MFQGALRQSSDPSRRKLAQHPKKLPRNFYFHPDETGPDRSGMVQIKKSLFSALIVFILSSYPYIAWAENYCSTTVSSDNNSSPVAGSLRSQINRQNGGEACGCGISFSQNMTIELTDPIELEGSHCQLSNSTIGTWITGGQRTIVIDATDLTRETAPYPGVRPLCAYMVEGGLSAKHTIQNQRIVVARREQAICNERGESLVDLPAGITSSICRDDDGNGTVTALECQFKGVQIDAVGCGVGADDLDGDCLSNRQDLCPYIIGTTCAEGDQDSDKDLIINRSDRCPDVPVQIGMESKQTRVGSPGKPGADSDNDGQENVCDPDDDGDRICDGPFEYRDKERGCSLGPDSCPTVANGPGSGSGQTDTDEDGQGDACDECPRDPLNDVDGDAVCVDTATPAVSDNCPYIPNGPAQTGAVGIGNQTDSNGNGIGDACETGPADTDADGDFVPDSQDNCLGLSNPVLDCDANPVTPSVQCDQDQDGRGDLCDVCPGDSSNDVDGDGVCVSPVGVTDNCPVVSNSSQTDGDGDGLGDACDFCTGDEEDNDNDDDGVCDLVDNCPGLSNNQINGDGDAFGDACDDWPDDPQNDSDGDGVSGEIDNCPAVPNGLEQASDPASGNQSDQDADGEGNACDICLNDPLNDADRDTICGDVDNCLGLSNPLQEDANENAIGDLCEVAISINDEDGDGIPNSLEAQIGTDPTKPDTEGDGVTDGLDCAPTDATIGQPGTCNGRTILDLDGDQITTGDNCPFISNSDQRDTNGDKVGDACQEPDADGDRIPDDLDNCPNRFNQNQEDFDNDGVGNSCEPEVSPTISQNRGSGGCSLQTGEERDNQLFLNGLFAVLLFGSLIISRLAKKIEQQSVKRSR